MNYNKKLLVLSIFTFAMFSCSENELSSPDEMESPTELIANSKTGVITNDIDYGGHGFVEPKEGYQIQSPHLIVQPGEEAWSFSIDKWLNNGLYNESIYKNYSNAWAAVYKVVNGKYTWVWSTWLRDATYSSGGFGYYKIDESKLERGATYVINVHGNQSNLTARFYTDNHTAFRFVYN